jgi:hypothetical protein
MMKSCNKIVLCEIFTKLLELDWPSTPPELPYNVHCMIKKSRMKFILTRLLRKKAIIWFEIFFQKLKKMF